MAKFERALSALTHGQCVRLPNWEPDTRMFVYDGMLVCQRGNCKPYIYDLCWEDIVASDWQLVERRARV